MFCFQENLTSEVRQISLPEAFLAIVQRPSLKEKIAQAREALAKGDKTQYDQIKRSLPGWLFQASSFEKSKNKHGREGMWRVQNKAHLSGLVVIDYDHIDVEAFKARLNEKQILQTYNEVLALIYVSPSGEGVKVVFKANPDWGNLVDNQAKMSQILEEKFDESCKDASRLSFATSSEDILYINNAILFYNYGDDYDKKYGEKYRQNISQGVHSNNNVSAANSSNSLPTDEHNGNAGGSSSDGDAGADGCVRGGVCDSSSERLTYGDIEIKRIAELYAQNFGEPVEGDRHRSLIKMAGHFRYLCDNNPRKLALAVRTFPWVARWEDAEHNTSEINDVCDAVCRDRMWREIPKALQRILDDKSLRAGASGDEGGFTEYSAGKGDNTFWDRLQPLLADDPTFSQITEMIRPENKLAAIYAAGGMLCTLMTRCSYQHYDGMQQRMNPMVYIIGRPASGKGFAQKMDENIMAALIAADMPGRKAEEDYKKEQRKRKSSAKAASGEKQIQAPEAVIRYIPSRTSNSVFYRRSLNAKEIVNGEQMMLHLYTFDSELDSQVQAQSGGSWIGKHDIELKAFHNEKSGVDYANTDSVNENIRVFWNQVMTGTDVSLAKKINVRNINDGLCSRLAIIRMFDDGYSMIEKGSRVETERVADVQKKWGFRFDALRGEIECSKLIDYCYNLCAKAGRAAEATDDQVLNFFRKRAIFYAEWFTIVRIVGRTLEQKENGIDCDYHKPTILESDLQFAELIYDSIIYWQDRFFGRTLEDVWREAENTMCARPLIRLSRNEQLFDTLPYEFSRQQAQDVLCTNYNNIRVQISRWISRNKIKKIGNGIYRKL